MSRIGPAGAARLGPPAWAPRAARVAARAPLGRRAGAAGGSTPTLLRGALFLRGGHDALCPRLVAPSRWTDALSTPPPRRVAAPFAAGRGAGRGPTYPDPADLSESTSTLDTTFSISSRREDDRARRSARLVRSNPSAAAFASRGGGRGRGRAAAGRGAPRGRPRVRETPEDRLAGLRRALTSAGAVAIVPPEGIVAADLARSLTEQLAESPSRGGCVEAGRDREVRRRGLGGVAGRPAEVLPSDLAFALSLASVPATEGSRLVPAVVEVLGEALGVEVLRDDAVGGVGFRLPGALPEALLRRIDGRAKGGSRAIPAGSGADAPLRGTPTGSGADASRRGTPTRNGADASRRGTPTRNRADASRRGVAAASTRGQPSARPFAGAEGVPAIPAKGPLLTPWEMMIASSVGIESQAGGGGKEAREEKRGRGEEATRTKTTGARSAAPDAPGASEGSRESDAADARPDQALPARPSDSPLPPDLSATPPLFLIDKKKLSSPSPSSLPSSPPSLPSRHLPAALSRALLVAVLGHVDHGKTTLLDRLLSTRRSGAEAGGITQRLYVAQALLDPQAWERGEWRGLDPTSALEAWEAAWVAASQAESPRAGAKGKRGGRRAGPAGSPGPALGGSAAAASLAGPEGSAGGAAPPAPAPPPKLVTFVDTPGHASFAAIRARGALAADLALVVVSCADGVGPQTREAVAAARAAGVPVVVALTKADLRHAGRAKRGAGRAPSRAGDDTHAAGGALAEEELLGQLSELGLVPEAWGGPVPVVSVSARTGEGMDALLETLILALEQSEEEWRAKEQEQEREREPRSSSPPPSPLPLPDGALPPDASLRSLTRSPVSGTVLECRLDPLRGCAATIRVERGVLRVGDCLLAGSAAGRVRAIESVAGGVGGAGTPSRADSRSDRDGDVDVEADGSVSPATPSAPAPLRLVAPGQTATVFGLGPSLPEAGDVFAFAADEKAARRAAREEAARREEARLPPPLPPAERGKPRLSVVLRASDWGAIDALQSAVATSLPQERVLVRLLRAAPGKVTLADLDLAEAGGGGVVVAFGGGGSAESADGSRSGAVAPPSRSSDLVPSSVSAAAERLGVPLVSCDVIYDAVDALRSLMRDQLPPVLRRDVLGSAKVLRVFGSDRAVAGARVEAGELRRGARARVLRGKGRVVVREQVEREEEERKKKEEEERAELEKWKKKIHGGAREEEEEDADEDDEDEDDEEDEDDRTFARRNSRFPASYDDGSSFDSDDPSASPERPVLRFSSFAEFAAFNAAAAERAAGDDEAWSGDDDNDDDDEDGAVDREDEDPASWVLQASGGGGFGSGSGSRANSSKKTRRTRKKDLKRQPGRQGSKTALSGASSPFFPSFSQPPPSSSNQAVAALRRAAEAASALPADSASRLEAAAEALLAARRADALLSLRVTSLRRGKDDAAVVEAGKECGLSCGKFSRWRPGDRVQCYRIVEERAHLTAEEERAAGWELLREDDAERLRWREGGKGGLHE